MTDEAHLHKSCQLHDFSRRPRGLYLARSKQTRNSRNAELSDLRNRSLHSAAANGKLFIKNEPQDHFATIILCQEAAAVHTRPEQRRKTERKPIHVNRLKIFIEGLE